MDALTDMDQFDEKQSSRPDLTAIQKINNKPKRSPKIRTMQSDSNQHEMSEYQNADISGQMFLWDASEDPNVVIRQSRLEGFVHSIFTSPYGVSPDVYSNVLKFFIIHMSPRFKKEIVEKMTLDEMSGFYKFKSERA